MREKNFIIRLTKDEFAFLKKSASQSGFKSIASFVRNKTMAGFEKDTCIIREENEYRRSERRSIFITNKLWFEMIDHVANKSSLSEFMCQAILEKISREKKLDIFS